MCGSTNANSGSGSTANGTTTTSSSIPRAGTVDYAVGGPYCTRTLGPVQPHVLYAVNMTAPNALKYLHLLVEEVLPRWAQEQPMEVAAAAAGGGGGTTTTQTTRTAIVKSSIESILQVASISSFPIQ
jgi:hypothetical protein